MPVVQSAFINGNTVTLSSAPTSGNTLIMTIGEAWTTTVTSVTGGGVTTWTKAVSFQYDAEVEIWYGKVDTTPSTSVTVAWSTGFSQSPVVGIVEVSPGSGSPVALDVTTSAQVTADGSGNFTTPSLTPTGAKELFVICVADDQGGSGGYVVNQAPSPWTPLGPVSGRSVQGAFYLSSDSSAHTAAMVVGHASVVMSCVAATFTGVAAVVQYPPRPPHSFVPQMRASNWRQKLATLIVPEHRFPDIRLAGG